MNHRTSALGAVVALGATAGGGTAAAQPAIALTGLRTLVVIDIETAQFMGSFDLPGDGRILGIDWRPSDQRLYAVTEAGQILRIDLDAQTAETVASTTILLRVDGPVAMNFNPLSDSIRLMSGPTNHRIDPDSGATTIDGAPEFAPEADVGGKTPRIVATAYRNSFGAPESTAQYDIDAGLGALVRQIAPDDGVLIPIGRLGIASAETYAFDIGTDPDGTNTGWLVADDMLHTVSLEDGSVTASWPLPEAAGTVRSLAILSHL